MPRKVPQRTCLGCRAVRPKREMIRIVRTGDNELSVDTSGKKAGRGAYVCPRTECLILLKKGKKIEKTLGVAPTETLYQEIQNLIAEKGKTNDSDTGR